MPDSASPSFPPALRDAGAPAGRAVGARSGAPTAPAPRPAPGAGPSPVQRALRKLGLARDIDFALYLPMRYEDETRIVRLADTRDGDLAQIEGVVVAAEVTFRPRRQLLVTIDDGSETCVLRFFNFYPSQQKQLEVGARVRVRGEVRGSFLGRQIMQPAVKSAGTELPLALTPVYSSISGLAQPVLRREVRAGLARAALDETIPHENLPERAWGLREALSFLHYPTPDVAMATLEDRSHPAWQRLKAEELLAQQLSQLQARRARAGQRAPALHAPADPESLHARLLALLPFALTTAQARVGAEIERDLARPVPMHRLLQGDVGSGKTVVAALAAARCIDAGFQCALMAPTEILAAQHFGKLVDWLDPLLAERGLRVAWLTGSQKKRERDTMAAATESGEAALVIGTHAVISEKVRFRRLALAIIDEQHRFGVAQRLALRGKAGGGGGGGSFCPAKASPSPPAGEASGSGRPGAGLEPHLLMMSATPIPRTLAMSYYADLDVSTLDELPPGRTPIVTKLVAEHRRDEVIGRIQGQLAQGRQVYWVCPLIEDSEAIDLRNATETRDELAETLGPRVGVGLLHSRMPTAEKQATMASFVAGRLQVLVSTTVIEVGVDVPNASLMVIEHAERFGLSQLHQLRGRVGRGAAASACVLLYAPNEGGRVGETARARLKAMVETGDGFEIARRDLDIRGPGEFLGARQSGAPLLRFADLEADAALLDWARGLAPAMLDRHPELAARHVERWLGGKSEYLKA